MSSSLVDDVRTQAAEAYGCVPNFFETMNAHTGMPGAVYLAADAALMDGLLEPKEQQIVLLELARYHSSRYDAVAHARMALDAGIPPHSIDALLAGDPPEDPRLAALVGATREACETRGWIDKETLDALKDIGVTRGELYEIFALIGLKTFASFTNHIADTPVDDGLKDTEDQLEHVPKQRPTIKRQRLFEG